METKYINVYEDSQGKYMSDKEYKTFEDAFNGRDLECNYIETVGIVRFNQQNQNSK